MKRGFVYVFAVLAWASRRVLAWRLSNTLTTEFCLEAVQEAIIQYSRPAIFHIDQGRHFTSQEFTGLLTQHGIQISMDGTGCWRDDVVVERLCGVSNMRRCICMPTRPLGLRSKAWRAI